METCIFGDEEVISPLHAKVYVFSDSVLCLGKDEREPTIKFCLGGQVDVFKVHQNTELWTIDGEPMEFEWSIFPRIHHIAAHQQSPRVYDQMGDPSQFKGRIIFMSMFNDIIWGSEDNDRECSANATLVSILAKRCPAGRCSFLGPGSEKKCCSTYIDKPRGGWDRVAELMMIKFSESGHPVFRATSPLPRGMLKSKGGGKLSIHFCADGNTIETFFAQLFLSISSVSTEQSQTV